MLGCRGSGGDNQGGERARGQEHPETGACSSRGRRRGPEPGREPRGRRQLLAGGRLDLGAHEVDREAIRILRRLPEGRLVT